MPLYWLIALPSRGPVWPVPAPCWGVLTVLTSPTTVPKSCIKTDHATRAWQQKNETLAHARGVYCVALRSLGVRTDPVRVRTALLQRARPEHPRPLCGPGERSLPPLFPA